MEDQAKIFSEKYIASPRSNIETLAHCDTIYREDIPIEQKMAFLMREVARNTELGWLRGIYGNNSAYLWYTDGKSKSGKKKEWVQVALSGKFDITPPHTSGRDYIIYKAAGPVYGEDNRINGVLAVEYDASQMSKDIGKIDLGRGGKLFVLDAEGTVIAEPDAEKIKADLFAAKEAAKNNTGGNSSSASTSEKKTAFRYLRKKLLQVREAVLISIWITKAYEKPLLTQKFRKQTGLWLLTPKKKSLWVLFITLSVCFASLQARAF